MIYLFTMNFIMRNLLESLWWNCRVSRYRKKEVETRETACRKLFGSKLDEKEGRCDLITR